MKQDKYLDPKNADSLWFRKCLSIRWRHLWGSSVRSVVKWCVPLTAIPSPKLMLRRSIGANSRDAGYIRVFDVSGHSTRDFPATPCRIRPRFFPCRDISMYEYVHFFSRYRARMFRFMQTRLRACFRCPVPANRARWLSRCLRIKNQANLKQTVVLHADETFPRDF